MTQGDGAKSTRSKAADRESSKGLAGDLLRRATSPEVLGGVAGAAAAAHFTKHAVEHAEDDEPGASPEAEDEAEKTDEASADSEKDADADADEHDSEAETETEDDDEADTETEDEADTETEDEADGDPTREETPDRPPVPAAPLDADDDRMQLLSRARAFAEQLTGHPVESFSGLAQEERGWRIEMEVVEVSRVPSTTDVLASYEVIVDGDGELVDFRRARRYYRNATDGGSA